MTRSDDTDLTKLLRRAHNELSRTLDPEQREDMPTALADWLREHHPGFGARPRIYADYLVRCYIAGKPIESDAEAYLAERDRHYQQR